MRVFSTFLILLFCPHSIVAEAAEIRVVTSPGLSAVFKVLGPQFERTTRHGLTFRYGLQAEQKKQIEAGDFDLAIVPSDVLDGEVKAGKIVAQTRIPVARVDLGVGVRAGAPKPDLRSVEAFKRAMLAAKSVAYVAEEPTGLQIASDFERLGIAEIMKAKTKPQKTISLVWKAVATGDGGAGIGVCQQYSFRRRRGACRPFSDRIAVFRRNDSRCCFCRSSGGWGHGLHKVHANAGRRFGPEGQGTVTAC